MLTACEQDQDGTEFRPDPARKLSAELCVIYHCCVYSEKTPDDVQRNCPKHVEFPSKNKFEKLVHLVGFVIGNGECYFSFMSQNLQISGRKRFCSCTPYGFQKNNHESSQPCSSKQRMP
jgi:hypothetical protein